jgi:hypothetical protein
MAPCRFAILGHTDEVQVRRFLGNGPAFLKAGSGRQAAGEIQKLHTVPLRSLALRQSRGSIACIERWHFDQQRNR